MEKGNTAVRKAIGDFAEKGPVVRQADMLEHTNRDDPVELFVDRAVVRKPEGNPIRTLGFSPGLRVTLLLLAERDSYHFCARLARQVKRQPAPSAANVEYALAGRQAKLHGNVALLGKLRLIESFGPFFEIGA